MISGHRRDARRGPLLAALLSVLFHAAIGAAVLLLRLPEAGSAPARTPMEVALVPAAREEPTRFTEQPADRAEDEAPEHPDFLSNVDARARDAEPGGESALPHMEGTADAPQVAMHEGRPEAAAPPPPETETRPEPPAPDAATEPEPEPQPQPGDAPGDAARPPETRETATLREQLAARSADPRLAAPGGDSDLPQDEMDHPTGNAELSGDITLSTTAWDYAPWLQTFRRQVDARWQPPMAYRLGMIDGWVRVRLEIARSGDLLGLQVLDQDVDHSSLTDAVLYAVRAAARYRELPAHFPDDMLVLTVRFVYPEVRRR
jgi:outer membrane biosynthesis protein TonB